MSSTAAHCRSNINSTGKIRTLEQQQGRSVAHVTGHQWKCQDCKCQPSLQLPLEHWEQREPGTWEGAVPHPPQTTYHGAVGIICSNEEYAALSRSATTSHNVFLPLSDALGVRFSGRYWLLLVWSQTLCLIGWSGFQFYYHSSQGDIFLKCRPSQCFRPSVNMFNTVLGNFHGSGWLLLKLLSLHTTPDFKGQNQEGLPLWAMLLRQNSVRSSQKFRLTAAFLLHGLRAYCSYENLSCDQRQRDF